MTVRLTDRAVRQTYHGPGAGQITQDVVIPPGSAANVASVLAQAGVIAHPFLFRLAVILTRGQGVLHAGEFRFPAHESLAGILNILRHGAPVQHQVTFPEGLTGQQIASILNAAPAATGHVAPPPDGAILPQTYDYLWGAKRDAILKRAEAALHKQLSAAWDARASGLPITTPRQALILASIVQQETPLPAELPKIAAVYENRLKLGMKLQADPTVIFAVTDGKQSGGVGITKADLANPSPYNTYVHGGLPPGPICAPGLAAIMAVLHPADSQALYFVATGDGGHVFSRTFQQQLKNIERYRAQLK